MDRVRRYDRIGHLSSPEQTPEGYMIYDAWISRPGVFAYKGKDGTIRRELRLPEEVYAPEAMLSFRGKPTVLLHPKTENGDALDLTPDNVRKYTTGHVLTDPYRDTETDRLRAKLLIMDRDHLEAIAAGVHEQSCGYKCRIEHTPGVHPVYGPYDAIQRDISGRHVATLPVARAGSDIKLRADGAFMVIDDDPPSPQTPEDAMEELMQELRDAIAALAEGQQAMAGKLDEMTGRMDGMMSKIDEGITPPVAAPGDGSGDGSGDDGRTDGADDPAQLHAARMDWHRERNKLAQLASASRIDGADDLSNADLARAIVSKRVPNLPANASDDYIRGVLAGITPNKSTQRQTGQDLAGLMAQSREDDADDADGSSARSAFNKRFFERKPAQRNN